MAKDKVYSVTVEVRLTVRAANRNEALLSARDAVATLDNIDTLKMTQVFLSIGGQVDGSLPSVF